MVRLTGERPTASDARAPTAPISEPRRRSAGISHRRPSYSSNSHFAPGPGGIRLIRRAANCSPFTGCPICRRVAPHGPEFLLLACSQPSPSFFVALPQRAPLRSRSGCLDGGSVPFRRGCPLRSISRRTGDSHWSERLDVRHLRIGVPGQHPLSPQQCKTADYA